MAVKNLLSREYINGAKEFVEVAKAHVNAEGHIRCPCMNCLNRKFQAPIAVQMHLIQKGIQLTYTVWSFHGESFHNPPVDYPEDDDDEMEDVLGDLTRHGGYGETSNTSGGCYNDLPTYDSNRHDKFDVRHV